MEKFTLVEFLAKQSLVPIKRKGWFSGEYVRLGDYARQAQSLFENGAVLGYMFREKVGALAELVSQPGQEQQTMASLQELAKIQLPAAGTEPQDTLDVFFKPEIERLMKLLRDAGATKRTRWMDFPKLEKKRMPWEGMLSSLQDALRRGVAFGSHYPTITQRLLLQVPNPESWSCLRGRNSDLPAAPPPPMDLAQRQAHVSSLILPFIESYHPDLLVRLGLWPENVKDVRLRLRALRARRMIPPPEG